jgi:hypothetical protein
MTAAAARLATIGLRMVAPWSNRSVAIRSTPAQAKSGEAERKGSVPIWRSDGEERTVARRDNVHIVARDIVSISSAPGWAARYSGDEEKVVTLLAWALVADGGERRLVGFVQRPPTAEEPAGAVVLADEIDGFSGYTAGALRTRASE